jgi:hypothetical protein
MAKFASKLKMEKLGLKDNGKWKLLSSLIYCSDVAKQTIVVPPGFTTDLASVPRLPIVFLLTGATSDEAAVVHDYLYSCHQVPRNVADAVLREASRVTGVPGWRRWMMWAAVRVFGGSHWKR